MCHLKCHQWAYKIKRPSMRYMVRLVALGFVQKEGFDLNKNYASVVSSTTLRILLSIATTLDW